MPTLGFAVLFLTVPELLAGIFSSDTAIIAATALYLRAAGVAQLAMAFENVFEGGLTGAGYTLWTMIVVVGISALRIPLASWVAPAFGLIGVWWMLAFTAIARGAAMTSLWVWGRWQQARA